MGPLAFVAVAVGALMIYAGFTGQPLVSTASAVLRGEKAGGTAGAGGGGGSLNELR